MAHAPQMTPRPSGVSARRQALDVGVQRGLYGVALWGARHWLAMVNTVAFVVFALPTVGAPLLRLAGFEAQADAIFAIYSITCHQMSERSWFPWGEQMAMCHRMTSIHGSFFLFGLLYTQVRRRFRPLPTTLLVAYSFPMAVDGFTQLFGWRESTWELRLFTGTLFGLAVVWYCFPHFELLMRLAVHSLSRQLQPAASPESSPA